ncbi:nitrous oxide reductase accessory protein NosL [Flavobacteriaceae bacterium 14752]|uniref:nitrous oxide reductase accessory protein NosL n=1 Tax=Mesohalobacter salilacus TaxID=2491711 RepID=UPI000F63DA65|nr:copper-binding protein [Flavobacteriaceae bacterium 14752]
MKKYVLFFIVASLFLSCSKSRQPINYGEDQCDFCSMSIVQKTHSAQLVTSKGKQYKFDAIECMVNFLKDDSDKYSEANLFVANYNQPGEMIDAENASYLISKNITSPMGANLSAFASTENAKEVQEKIGGRIYNWSELQTVITKDIHQHH